MKIGMVVTKQFKYEQSQNESPLTLSILIKCLCLLSTGQIGSRRFPYWTSRAIKETAGHAIPGLLYNSLLPFFKYTTPKYMVTVECSHISKPYTFMPTLLGYLGVSRIQNKYPHRSPVWLTKSPGYKGKCLNTSLHSYFGLLWEEIWKSVMHFCG